MGFFLRGTRRGARADTLSEWRHAADGLASPKPMSAWQHAYNISDLREIARKRLPRGVFEFVDRGTEDEVSLSHNAAALPPSREYNLRNGFTLPFSITRRN